SAASKESCTRSTVYEHTFVYKRKRKAARGRPFAILRVGVCRLAGLDRRLERAPRRELRDGRRCDVALLARARVHARAGRARRGRKLAEAGERDGVTLLQRVRDRVQDGVHRSARLTLGHAGRIGYGVHEILLGHFLLLTSDSVSRNRRSLTLLRQIW